MPERIQLSRRKGWRMPPNTVKVDRTTHFGNPFKAEGKATAGDVVRLFARFMRMSQAQIMRQCLDDAGQPNPLGGLRMIILRQAILKRLPELRGKNLACWCRLGEPCHADVLLRLANREPR